MARKGRHHASAPFNCLQHPRVVYCESAGQIRLAKKPEKPRPVQTVFGVGIVTAGAFREKNLAAVSLRRGQLAQRFRRRQTMAARNTRQTQNENCRQNPQGPVRFRWSMFALDVYQKAALNAAVQTKNGRTALTQPYQRKSENALIPDHPSRLVHGRDRRDDLVHRIPLAFASRHVIAAHD